MIPFTQLKYIQDIFGDAYVRFASVFATSKSTPVPLPPLDPKPPF